MLSPNTFYPRSKKLKARCCSNFLKKGTINSAALNLMAATMGAGTVTMPYIVTKLGILLALLLIILGAFLSYYSSMLLVKCSLADNQRI